MEFATVMAFLVGFCIGGAFVAFIFSVKEWDE